MRMGLNYINTKGDFWIPIKKGKHEPRTQIRIDFFGTLPLDSM
jgi:CRISPR-associated protein Cas5h